MINNPGETAALIGGAALTAISLTGEGGGVALSSTGVGAIVGVPLAAVSILGVTAGATITATAAGSLAMHAASDDGVSPMRTDHGHSSGSGGKSGTKTSMRFATPSAAW